MAGCDDTTCTINPGFTCFTPTSHLRGQKCELAQQPEILRIYPTNDNNLIVEFNQEIQITGKLTMDDLEIIISNDEKQGEFSDPLTWEIPDFVYTKLPSQFIEIKLSITREQKYTGPEVRVRHMNSDKIVGQTNGDKLKGNAWGWTYLDVKDFNANPGERQELSAFVGITSNVLIWSSIGLSAVTSLITAKTMLPAAIAFISYQKLYLLSLVDVKDNIFRRSLSYFSYTFGE